MTFASIFAGLATSVTARPGPDAEARVLRYVREHAAPGKPVLITELYNNVFTRPDERQALNKLYRAFFRIPLFVAQYRSRFGAPPKLARIAEQFDLKSEEDASTLLLVMELDPRVPRFIQRDRKTGEITSVDEAMVRNDRRFAEIADKHLGGWEGAPAPDFTLPGLDSPPVTRDALKGKTALLYVWFTGCPPCVKQTPELVELDRKFAASGLVIVGANADKLLELGYDDSVRLKYRAEQNIRFAMTDWDSAANTAFGSISIFPTMFLVDSQGVIIHHWVGYTSKTVLEPAVEAALTSPRP